MRLQQLNFFSYRSFRNRAPLKTLSKRQQIWYNRTNKKKEEKEMQFGFFDIEKKENRLSQLGDH
ncbi:MAG: hypothetical protein IKN72_10125, partial [Clostridia bacterium]|nr:hypothetical protein [Clostridia bacterium]